MRRQKLERNVYDFSPEVFSQKRFKSSSSVKCKILMKKLTEFLKCIVKPRSLIGKTIELLNNKNIT
jgi:hypothetical protein